MNYVHKPKASNRRTGGRSARRAAKQASSVSPAVSIGHSGGTYLPLSLHDIERIHSTALDVLENIGVADPVPRFKEVALKKGCTITSHGRLSFPRSLIEDCIALTPNKSMYLSRYGNRDLELSGHRVHFDSGGEAVNTLEIGANAYRPSTLLDLYDFARLIDCLDHMDSFYKVVVPTDISDHYAHDINGAYAAFAGTEKHVELSFTNASYIDDVLEMLYLISGSKKAYQDKPFCSSGGCPIVSPLSYGEENSEICIESTRFNSPVDIVIAPQAGATAPAALAGTLVQTMAETLAGLMLVQLTTPGHEVTFGVWPFISDLRTGSFSGGGGEQALLAAAAVQIGKFYDIPTSVGAGMTDSKSVDSQMGFERGITTVLAALAGSNVVSEVGGMMASLLGCSFESAVIDNEMLGMVKRILRGIEVNDETLSYKTIEDVVHGTGHFLGHEQTLDMMESEFLYPRLADRTSPEEWEENGSKEIRDQARSEAKELLSIHYPTYIDPSIDSIIRDRFPILLPKEFMRPNSNRW